MECPNDGLHVAPLHVVIIILFILLGCFPHTYVLLTGAPMCIISNSIPFYTH